MLGQLFAGGIVSFVNFGVHALMTGLVVVATRRTASLTDHMPIFARISALLTVTVTALMIAHVAEIALWGLYYGWAGVTASVHPFEFAFENYTALGYGDVVPTSQWRLIGPITALNGLLLIGWSVAIIFEVLRMAEIHIGRRARSG